MTILEETQAKLALAAIKLEKLHDDYKVVNPENIYWLLRMKRALTMLREASFKLMELESIELPSNEGSEGLKSLVQQLIIWKPDTKNPTDCVMALWFCELRAREIVNNGNINQTHIKNRWATRKQLDTRFTVNVNDYEMSSYE